MNAMVVYYYKNPDIKKRRMVTKSLEKLLHINWCNRCYISEQKETMFYQDSVKILSAMKYSWKENIFLHDLKNELVVMFVGTKEIAMENIKISKLLFFPAQNNI